MKPLDQYLVRKSMSDLIPVTTGLSRRDVLSAWFQSPLSVVTGLCVSGCSEAV